MTMHIVSNRYVDSIVPAVESLCENLSPYCRVKEKLHGEQFSVLEMEYYGSPGLSAECACGH